MPAHRSLSMISQQFDLTTVSQHRMKAVAEWLHSGRQPLMKLSRHGPVDSKLPACLKNPVTYLWVHIAIWRLKTFYS